MLEIPEAIVIAAELNQTILDKRIEKVIAAASPHKFAWFFSVILPSITRSCMAEKSKIPSHTAAGWKSTPGAFFSILAMA